MIVLFPILGAGIHQVRGWPTESVLMFAIIGVVVSLGSLALLVTRRHTLVRPSGPPKSWLVLIGEVIRDAFALFGAFMLLTAFGITFESTTELTVLALVIVGLITLVALARHRRSTH